jgi:NDP-sugar pyrophosphorylase family protein
MSIVQINKQIIWIKLDQYLSGLKHDIYLCCLYIKHRIKAVCPENDELFEQLTYFINKIN